MCFIVIDIKHRNACFYANIYHKIWCLMLLQKMCSKNQKFSFYTEFPDDQDVHLKWRLSLLLNQLKYTQMLNLYVFYFYLALSYVL